jgi:hypothetical protein
MNNFSNFAPQAEVAELVDALRSGRSRCTPVRVRVSSSVQVPFQKFKNFHFQIFMRLRKIALWKFCRIKFVWR